MDGLELCKAIAAERPEIKVLMISLMLVWREQVSITGLPYLQKPFTPTALREFHLRPILGPISSVRRRRPGVHSHCIVRSINLMADRVTVMRFKRSLFPLPDTIRLETPTIPAVDSIYPPLLIRPVKERNR